MWEQLENKEWKYEKLAVVVRSPQIKKKRGHFTFLFCRGIERNVQRFITHVRSFCFPDRTFCLVALSLPLPWRFTSAPFFHCTCKREL